MWVSWADGIGSAGLTVMWASWADAFGRHSWTLRACISCRFSYGCWAACVLSAVGDSSPFQVPVTGYAQAVGRISCEPRTHQLRVGWLSQSPFGFYLGDSLDNFSSFDRMSVDPMDSIRAACKELHPDGEYAKGKGRESEATRMRHSAYASSRLASTSPRSLALASCQRTLR